MINFIKATTKNINSLAKMRSLFLMEMTECSEKERQQIEKATKIYFETAVAEETFIAWLAFDGDRVIATSGLIFYTVPPALNFNGKVAYIMNMYTLPEYRKQGIGKELLNRTIDEATNRGYKIIKLHATDIGRPLYEQKGFNDGNGEMELKI